MTTPRTARILSALDRWCDVRLGWVSGETVYTVPAGTSVEGVLGELKPGRRVIAVRDEAAEHGFRLARIEVQ